jgi:hypothetical protein
MAYFRKGRSGNWRVEIERDGIRESRTFADKRAANAWARARETDIIEATYIARLRPEWNLRPDGTPVLPAPRSVLAL